MLSHYIKIALRNVLKYKAQSAISITGLAVSFVFITLAVLWVRYEVTYDTAGYADNVYAVLKQSEHNANNYGTRFNGTVPEKILRTYPEVAAATNIASQLNVVLLSEKGDMVETMSTEQAFFDVFGIPFIHGDKKTALTNPNSVVINEHTAERLFGSAADALGKALKTEDAVFTITGVTKNIDHTTLYLDALIPFTSWDKNLMGNTDNMNYFATYIRLKDNVDKAAFFKKLYSDKSFFNQKQAYYEIEKEFRSEADFYSGVYASPLSQLRYKYHVYTDSPALPLNYTYIIILLSISILLFACALLSYISLFISHTIVRLRTLGLRKAIGSSNRQLFTMLLTEFTLTLLISFIIGICVLEISYPLFEGAVGINSKAFDMSAIIIVFGIIVSVLSIAPPLWHICTQVVKNNIAGRKTGQQNVQKILLAIQFVIGIFFLFISVVMYCQLRLIQNKDLGVDIKNMLQIESGEASTHYELFKKNLNPVITELKKSPFIEHAFRQPEELISHKNFRPSDYIEWEGKNEIDQFSLDLLMIDDYSFFDAFRIKKKEGRLFSENHGNETDKVVINEKLAARINNPLGKNIKLNDRQYEIIGIVNDFQLYSPTEEPPATMVMLSSWLSYIYVRLQNDKTTEALEYINSILQKHGISNYKMRFLTDKYSDFTKADRLVMQIISSVAVVCLIVSIFATYSLTLFTMERRRREVAIRKVMGASVTNIIRLFLKEYMWLAAVACIVSIPPAYYIMHKWLQSYIYRINITWWLVAAVIIIVVAVIIATVLRQIIKAANSNPAEVIKYD